jgi:hypothetical protein
MRILINNYSSNIQTECFYLSSTINLIKGCSSIIWENKEHSAYDIFDMFKPNYFIAHISQIYTDAIHYMVEHKDIKLIVNVTGADKETVKQLENILIDKGVDIAFFYTNADEELARLKNHNMISIPFGSDVFSGGNTISYDVDTAFFVNKESDIPQIPDLSYHSLSLNKNMNNYTDIVLPIPYMKEIYKNYHNIVIKSFDDYIPQLFFDSVFYGNNVKYDLDDSEKQSKVENKLKKLLKIDNINDFAQVKRAVKNKHTCLHRTKTLLSQLPSHGFISQLDDIIKVYTGDIK